MRHPFSRLALLAAFAGLGLLGPGTGTAKDGEVREPRETRDLREARERELRDLERARRDATREQERERERQDSRSGSNSGSDSDDRDDDEDKDEDDREDRSGSNSGSDGQRATSGSGRIDVERTRGGDRQRGEVLLIGPDEDIPTVRGAGYTLLSERRLESLRRTMVRVRVRDGQSVEQLMESLRQLVPRARVAPNHIYNPSQQASSQQATAVTLSSAASAPGNNGAADIGIIDTGADANNAKLRPLLLAQRGFASGGYQDRPHGTAVAQLAAGQGAKLAIADVFGVDARNQLVAPAELIAAALDWMISQRIRVVNISIEGPYNAVLEFVIEDAITRGIVIVAAAGNGGPSSAPAYPAAYAGVIAVTALDERGQIYRRAARGQHLQFAARGSYSVNQSQVDTKVPLAGTSFAAPVVAAEFAQRWRSRPNASREEIVAALRSEATDMGKPGRDAIYGWGRIAD
jgi:minor extracellular protease Epr